MNAIIKSINAENKLRDKMYKKAKAFVDSHKDEIKTDYDEAVYLAASGLNVLAYQK